LPWRSSHNSSAFRLLWLLGCGSSETLPRTHPR
jgi:hypothetical protein